MRIILNTRHRTLVILTGDDADNATTDNDDEDETVVDASGGQFEPAPTFGFAPPDEDDDNE